MPYDIWFYNYALQIFDARKNFLINGSSFAPPIRPVFPRNLG